MNKSFCFLFFSFLFKVSIAQDKNYKVENAQQRKATYIIDQIEKDNIDSIYKYFDPVYFKSKTVKIKQLLTKFHRDYLAMNPQAKRHVNLVWPEGYNLFRFSYIDSTGIALQIDLSFKDHDINSNIFLLETVDKETFKKQREHSSNTVRAINIGPPITIKYPKHTIIEYRNCNKEMRTITFGTVLHSFQNWVRGSFSWENNKTVHFSSRYQLDSNFIRQNIIKVRAALPKDFWDFNMFGEMYNNEPNEDAIWFMNLFVQIDKKGNVKIYSAIKLTFEGTDARIDNNRRDPKIINIEFIVDKMQLAQLEKDLKKASRPG